MTTTPKIFGVFDYSARLDVRDYALKMKRPNPLLLNGHDSEVRHCRKVEGNS